MSTAALPDDALTDLYRAPLEDFVKRRDALVKELRAGGDREGAAAVKRLRKPSRSAWALNLGVLESPDALTSLVEAVATTLDAQAAGGDVRAAIASLRSAVHVVADRAAAAASQSGHRIESGALMSAVLAVLGRQESFDLLCRGRLNEVPEAGGLDFLASLPAPPQSVAGRRDAHASSAIAAPDLPAATEGGREAAADEAARRAGQVLEVARTRAGSADRARQDAGLKLKEAEERLRRAESEAEMARSAYEQAAAEAAAAATELVDAERARSDAEQRSPGRS